MIKSADDIVLDIKLGYFADGWSPRGRPFYRDNSSNVPDPLKLISKMKMNKKQYNDLKKDLAKVFAKHRFDPCALPVVGQREVEQQITNRELYNYYHPATYGSKTIFDEFVKTKDLKLVWARNSSRVKHYQLDPYDVAKIALDYCHTVTGAVLDYGIGNHPITDNSYFRPGIDLYWLLEMAELSSEILPTYTNC